MQVQEGGVARASGLGRLGHVAIDATRIAASASRNRIDTEQVLDTRGRASGGTFGYGIRRLDGAAQLLHHLRVETRCAQCGAVMTCRPEGGCWCVQLPPVPMLADGKGCLCEKCLRARIEALRQPGKSKQP